MAPDAASRRSRASSWAAASRSAAALGLVPRPAVRVEPVEHRAGPVERLLRGRGVVLDGAQRDREPVVRLGGGSRRGGRAGGPIARGRDVEGRAAREVALDPVQRRDPPHRLVEVRRTEDGGGERRPRRRCRAPGCGPRARPRCCAGAGHRRPGRGPRLRSGERGGEPVRCVGGRAGPRPRSGPSSASTCPAAARAWSRARRARSAGVAAGRGVPGLCPAAGNGLRGGRRPRRGPGARGTPPRAREAAPRARPRRRLRAPPSARPRRRHRQAPGPLDPPSGGPAAAARAPDSLAAVTWLGGARRPPRRRRGRDDQHRRRLGHADHLPDPARARLPAGDGERLEQHRPRLRRRDRGTWGYRRELDGPAPRRGPARRRRRCLGSVAGALLLLRLPASAFEAIVPVLIVVALVLVRPPAADRGRGRRRGAGSGPAAEHTGRRAGGRAPARSPPASTAGTSARPRGCCSSGCSGSLLPRVAAAGERRSRTCSRSSSTRVAAVTFLVVRAGAGWTGVVLLIAVGSIARRRARRQGRPPAAAAGAARRDRRRRARRHRAAAVT